MFHVYVSLCVSAEYRLALQVRRARLAVPPLRWRKPVVSPVPFVANRCMLNALPFV